MGSYDPEMDGYVPLDISLANLTLGDKVGEGSPGDVYRAVVADPNGGPPIAAIAKAYKRNVRGRDWFSFYADERAGVAASPRLGMSCPSSACRIGRVFVWADAGVVTLSAALERDAGSIPPTTSARVLTSASSRTRSGSARTRSPRRRGARSREGSAANLEMHGAGAAPRRKPDNAATSPAAGSSADAWRSSTPRVRRFRTGRDATATRLCSIPRTALRNNSLAAQGWHRDGSADTAAVAGDTSAGIVATGAPPTPAFDAFSVGLVLLRAAVPAASPRGDETRARGDGRRGGAGGSRDGDGGGLGVGGVGGVAGERELRFRAVGRGGGMGTRRGTRDVGSGTTHDPAGGGGTPLSARRLREASRRARRVPELGVSIFHDKTPGCAETRRLAGAIPKRL